MRFGIHRQPQQSLANKFEREIYRRHSSVFVDANEASKRFLKMLRYLPVPNSNECAEWESIKCTCSRCYAECPDTNNDSDIPPISNAKLTIKRRSQLNPGKIKQKPQKQIHFHFRGAEWQTGLPASYLSANKRLARMRSPICV